MNLTPKTQINRIKNCDYNFKLCHQNLQSIGNSADKINFMLKQENPHIFGVTEHWKTKDVLETYGISGYKLISSFCRKDGYGGSAIYSVNEVKCLEKPEIRNCAVENIIECAGVELRISDTKIICLIVYRPPKGNIELFFEKLSKILDQVILEKAIIYVAGDINIEMLTKCKEGQILESLLMSYNLKQTVFQNTRITRESSSCVDNIFTNFEGNLFTNVVEYHISDHMGQTITCNIIVNTNKHILGRNFSEENKCLFLKKMKAASWKQIYEIEKKSMY